MTTAKASSSASSSSPPHRHAHHFQSGDHEFESCKLGVWVFLCTEILMFGGLFVLYAVFHSLYSEAFSLGAHHLDWRLGAINTLVLLCSSFTMVMGIYFAQKNNRKLSGMSLALTLFFGLVFMCIKYFEYSHKFHMGLFPGELFSYQGEGFQNPQLPLYFSLYFSLTGLHGAHVLIGMGLILWVMIRAFKGEFNENYYTPLEGVGLFWHLVDVIWIYLFPLLYLIG